MTSTDAESRPPQLPGLDEAYAYVRPAYDIVLRRVDVAEARARANLGFAGTLMFAAPAFVAATLGAGHRSFTSPWFIAGAVAFVCVYGCVVAQQIPRFVGEIQVITPHGLNSAEWLGAQPDLFKYNAFQFAVNDWVSNRSHVNKLVGLATAGAVLLAVQVACLAMWVWLG